MTEKMNERTITVALAGAPNTGKSTVFNLLPGFPSMSVTGREKQSSKKLEWYTAVI